MIEREACFHCGEMIAVEARICPFRGRVRGLELLLVGANPLVAKVTVY